MDTSKQLIVLSSTCCWTFDSHGSTWENTLWPHSSLFGGSTALKFVYSLNFIGDCIWNVIWMRSEMCWPHLSCILWAQDSLRARLVAVGGRFGFVCDVRLSVWCCGCLVQFASCLLGHLVFMALVFGHYIRETHTHPSHTCMHTPHAYMNVRIMSFYTTSRHNTLHHMTIHYMYTRIAFIFYIHTYMHCIAYIH